MEAKENFPDFVRRWKANAALMTDRLSDKDQIRIISRNLQPSLARHHVLAQASETFNAYYAAGMVVEEALANGVLEKVEPAYKSKPRNSSRNANALFGNPSPASSSNPPPNPTAGVNQIQTPQNNQLHKIANLQLPKIPRTEPGEYSLSLQRLCSQ